jgi:MSHA pilin protein MshD
MRMRGFTLVEVVLVIVITAIAIPTLVFVLGQQARFTVDSEKIVAAADLGQDLTEEIRSKGFDAAAGYNGYTDNKTLSTVLYTRDVTVCDVNPADLDTCAGASDYRRISVTVTSDLGVTEIVTLLTDY